MANRRQQKHSPEHAISATLRSMAGKRGVAVHYDANGIHAFPGRDETSVHLSPLPHEATAQDRAVVRGEADTAALMLRHHNATLHHKLRPGNAVAGQLFDSLEQARVEALGMSSMAGVAANIREKNTRYYVEQGLERLSERADPPVGDLLAALLHERITGQPAPEPIARLLAAWRGWIENSVGSELNALLSSVHEQRVFSKTSRTLIRKLQGAIAGEPSTEEESDSDEHDEEAPPLPNDEQGNEESATASSGGEEATPDPSAQDNKGKTAAMGEANASERLQTPGQQPTRPELDWLSATASETGYQVYTTRFDETVKVSELATPEELAKLRFQLDLKLGTVQSMVARLANRLQRKLMAKQTRAWEFDQEEGLLDAGRLSRLITNPLHEKVYKTEKETEFRDTIVTLLLDNSGSMRGRPITVAALTTDILARTLERCGVKVEILGFTTREWKGGRSRQQWIKDGSPAAPGRLNDLRHIIFKPADTPLRQARRNLGLMLKEGVLKENIDGEAILWAHGRLLKRREKRRILMIVSDGAPVDDSTLSANGGNYLDRHLRETIRRIEQHSPVELLAIGIGHDVTRYYKRAVTISDVEQLGGAIVGELSALFGLDRRRNTKAA